MIVYTFTTRPYLAKMAKNSKRRKITCQPYWQSQYPNIDILREELQSIRLTKRNKLSKK